MKKCYIENAPEGFLICDAMTDVEYMGGDTLETAAQTAENMGYDAVYSDYLMDELIGASHE